MTCSALIVIGFGRTMTSNHQTNAKSLERRVCKALGGSRRGPNPGSDCVDVPYSVECKRMLRPGLRAVHLEQARRQSKVDGKPWLLVVGGHNDSEPICVLDFKTFVDVLNKAGVVNAE